MNDYAEIALRAGSLFHLGFAIFHLLFWRLFRWKEDLASLTSLNRNVMQILNLCLTFVFFTLAYLSAFHTRELIATGLGRALCAAFALFWFLRAVEQVVFFGLRRRLSVAFTAMFFVGSLLYVAPLM